jgi:CHAD domain-containing protein
LNFLANDIPQPVIQSKYPSTSMALDLDRAEKTVRTLRKLLKKMSNPPTPEEVHDFRTTSRRVDATLKAFSLDSEPSSHRLLKRLARLRKRAGKVRDMDVLTDFGSTVRPKGENECSIMLLEHLGARRQKHAAKLRAAVRQRGLKLGQRLKRISTEFETRLPEASAHVAALAVKLSTDLASPARLHKGNLHPYRLKVKELRDMLQMADNADQQEFITSLGEVKDAIGEWHDWQELTEIAADILDHGPRCQLLRELQRIREVKYQRALGVAAAMRKKHLRLPPRKTGRTRGARQPIPAKPAWQAAAALAA